MAFAIFSLLSLSSKMCAQTTDIQTEIVSMQLRSTAPFHQIIKTGKTTTITESGSYQLLENITGEIIINADNVIVDLNGYTITGDENSGIPVIKVREGRTNVLIKNGSITLDDPFSEDGIVICENVCAVRLEDLCLFDLKIGIWFAGKAGEEIKCSKVTNCFATNCVKAFVIEFTANTVFEHCENCCCQEAGFEFFKSKFNKIKKCKSIGVGTNNNAPAVGFSATSGRDNLFFECFAEGIYKTQTQFGANATGFLFKGTPEDAGERESKIVNCLVDSVSANILANAYGIHLDMVLKDPIPTCPLVAENFEGGITDVSWSPIGDKIALSADDGIHILQFDCCTWSEVRTLTFQNVENLEWGPTGRYLAMGADEDNGVLVHDSLYDLVFEANFGEGASNPVWSRDGKYVMYVLDGESYVVYKVGTAGLTEVTGAGDIGLGTDHFITNPAITPDEKFIAFPSLIFSSETTDVHIFNWRFFSPFLDPAFLGAEADGEVSALGDTINSAAWNPIACGSLYYLVVVGSKKTPKGDPNIEVFRFDNTDPGLPTLTSIAKAQFDVNPLLRVKWAPNGKHFAVFGDNGSVAIFAFNPSSGTILTEVYAFTLGFQVSAGGLDWSPSGRYITLGGTPDTFDGKTPPEAPDFAILEVANVPTRCVIDRNKIANVTGGLCGIGIEGSSSCNGIMRNISYENDLNFSRFVLNVWYDGLLGIDQFHYNVSIPPH